MDSLFKKIKNKFVALKNKPLFIKFIDFFKIYKLPLLSGVLFGCIFIPFSFFSLFFAFVSLWFFAFVPLWFFIYRQTSFRRVLTGCLLCQMVSTLIGFNWMAYTFHSFGGMSWFLSLIFLVLFCCIANLYIVFSGCLWFVLTKKSSVPLPVSVKLILFPLIFSLLHSLIPTIFPWNMGYPLFWWGLPIAQTAELWGFRFLDSLFYIFNLLFLILYEQGFNNTGKRALAGAVTLFACLNLLGFYLKRRLPPPDKFLNVIVIQNNVGSVFHLDSKSFYNPRRKAFYASKFLTYRTLSRYTKNKDKQKEIDLIVWPEGAYAYAINKEATTDKRLSKMIKNIQIPLITGVYSKNHRTANNSLFAFDREGNILRPAYDKIKLLVFGEYFPGIKRFPFLRKMFPYFGSNFTPGKDVLVQELEGARFGWQICYESLFDKFSREMAQKQAQILVNIANDSWYGSWQEPSQHLNINFARVIEVRRPLIRSTNTGYSGVIHADGTMDKTSPLNRAWSHLYKVPYYKNPPKTLFISWGYYINEIFLSFLALFCLIYNNLVCKFKFFNLYPKRQI